MYWENCIAKWPAYPLNSLYCTNHTSDNLCTHQQESSFLFSLLMREERIQWKQAKLKSLKITTLILKKRENKVNTKHMYQSYPQNCGKAESIDIQKEIWIFCLEIHSENRDRKWLSRRLANELPSPLPEQQFKLKHLKMLSAQLLEMIG